MFLKAIKNNVGDCKLCDRFIYAKCQGGCLSFVKSGKNQLSDF